MRLEFIDGHDEEGADEIADVYLTQYEAAEIISALALQLRDNEKTLSFCIFPDRDESSLRKPD